MAVTWVCPIAASHTVRAGSWSQVPTIESTSPSSRVTLALKPLTAEP